MALPVVYLSFKDEVPSKGYWDQGFVDDLIRGWVWDPVGGKDLMLAELEDVEDGCVIIFPARSQADQVDVLNNAIARLKWVVLILTGDEENEFPVEQVRHPNINIWVMSPRMGRHDEYRRLGSGYPPSCRENLHDVPKDLDWAFAGQITHELRFQASQQMHAMLEDPDLTGELHESQSFTAGLAPEPYYALMSRAKVCPSPSGAVCPDSFRTFEALEAGAIPIVDAGEWWPYVFSEPVPFPELDSYEQLPGYTKDQLIRWEWKSAKVSAWWQARKRKYAYELSDDLPPDEDLGLLRDKITVLIPTSPIPSHPSTQIIAKTISDVRSQLPDSEILVMVDGHQSPEYDEYVRRLTWQANHEWRNVLPVIFDEPLHQSEMTRRTLSMVNTKMLLYVEHDAPITPDMEFQWYDLCDFILGGHAHVIRFAHEASGIHPEHAHLFGDPEYIGPLRMVKSWQWSQRPHLASVAFYRHMLENYFANDERMFIEDRMHGIVASGVEDDPMNWYLHRLWMYLGDDLSNAKRSTHLDGRHAGAS